QLLDNLYVRKQMFQEIQACTLADKHTDPACKFLVRISSCFERFDCTFHEEPLLRVHDLCIAGGKAEECCVKQVNVFEDKASLYVIGIGQLLGSHACLQ